MQTDHEELARRVESEQPSRGVDCAVAVASGEYLTGTGRDGMLAHRDTPNQFSFHVPRYTTSVDDALSLVPEGFRDVFHLFVVAGEPDIWECDLGRNCTEARGQSKTPAQAITAASLRARALKEAK